MGLRISVYIIYPCTHQVVRFAFVYKERWYPFSNRRDAGSNRYKLSISILLVLRNSPRIQRFSGHNPFQLTTKTHNKPFLIEIVYVLCRNSVFLDYHSELEDTYCQQRFYKYIREITTKKATNDTEKQLKHWGVLGARS